MEDKGYKGLLEELEGLLSAVKRLSQEKIENDLRKGLNRLKFSPEVEGIFSQYYLNKYIWQMRLALITGIFLYGMFGLLDSYIFPENKLYMWIIRYAIVIPTGVVILALTYKIKEEKLIHLIHSLLVVVAGFGIIMMVYFVSENKKSFLYYGGLLLVVFYAYSLSGMRFYYATLSSLTITLLYPMLELTVIKSNKEQLFMNMFFLVSSNVLGIPTSYMIERQRRKDFLLTALLAIEKEKGEELVNRLRDMSYVDGLTGIANRRRFEDELDKEWGRAIRTGRPLSLLMVDIDFFKRYNDSEGHLKGDECLKKVAAAIENSVRDNLDLVARYGGEEFAVIIPETDMDHALRVAERIRRAVEDLKISHPNSEVSKFVTISVGVATMLPKKGMDKRELIRRADTALYRAKREGRNRVIAFLPQSEVK